MRLSAKVHILFVHVSTKVGIYLATEKIKVQEIRMVFESLTYGLLKGTPLNLICIVLKL